MGISRTKYVIPDSTRKEKGAFSLFYHYEMVSDKKRVEPFRNAIKTVCPDKIVLESGTGTALMSILAAQNGAEQVFAIESDSNIIEIARQNIDHSGFAKKIKLIHKDIFDLTLDDLEGHLVDVVIAENLSTWNVTEPQLQIVNYVNKNFTKKTTIFLPEKISNFLELAYAQYVFESSVEIKTHFFEFTGVKKAQTMSKPVCYVELEMKEHNPVQFSKKIVLEANQSGLINSVRLSSPLRIYGCFVFDSSDSLMPPVIYPLPEELSVNKGDLVEISIEYQAFTSWKDFLIVNASLKK